MEDATWATENQLYNIVDGRRIAKTVEPGASGIASFGAKFYRTNGNNSNERTGLGIVLKVMKGDQVKITAESFYSIPGGNAGVPINMAASELLNALLGAKGFPVGKGLSSTNLAALNTPTSLQSFLNTNSGNSSLAKAAVNYALFDEQMRFVGGDYDPVPSGGGYKNHQKFFNSPVNITRSGYLYIYVSNESNLNVFFDNLNVSHTNGPILEETHYYPFGLTMAGISSKSLSSGGAENKLKYNGKEEQRKEFSDGSGLELLDYGARMYDAQIGRWNHIDPMSEKWNSFSPYNFTLNSPINYVDPDGRDVILLTWATADRSNGHTAVAIENYIEVKKRDKNGNVVYDSKGNAKTKMVSARTFTLYELGPEGSSKMDKGDDAQKDSQPFYHAVGTFTEAELINNKSGGNNISAYDEYAPDGVIRIKTDYTGDSKATAAMNKLLKDNQPFNPASNNCSVFGVCAINAATGQNVGGTETIKAKGQQATTVTPNALFRSVRNLPSANVLVDPGAKINNRFIQGKYPLLYPLIED